MAVALVSTQRRKWSVRLTRSLWQGWVGEGCDALGIMVLQSQSLYDQS